MIWPPETVTAPVPTGQLGGAGIGWRPEIAGVVAGLPELGFCEVIAEGIDPDDLPRAVVELRTRGIAVVPHGVRLSLGGAEPVEAARVTRLAATAAALGSPLVSEHVAFVRSAGREAGHLLPVPRTRAALQALAANVRRLQDELDVPVALEPIAALVDWPDDEYTEADFLAALLDRTGAHLLLDVANVHANALNRGRDAEETLDALPLDRVAYVHVAGGAMRADGLYYDTHTHTVPPEVLRLLGALRERLPADPPVLLERDGAYPPAGRLRAEFAAVAAAAAPAVPAVVPGAPVARPVLVTGPAPVPAPRHGAVEQAPPTPSDGRAAPSTDEALAAAQARLLDALVAGAPDPPGFDPHRLGATRAALVRKRAGGVAAEWPLLAASLGTTWSATFAEHVRGRPPQGPLRDGWDLARVLRAAGRLTGGAAVELAEREAAFRYDGTGPPRPRGRLARALRRTRPRKVSEGGR